MARRATRGHSGKKNSKVTLKDVKVAMEEASQSVDGDADLSEEERNGEFLECGTQGGNGLEVEALAVSDLPEVEVCDDLPEAEVSYAVKNLGVSGVKKGLSVGEVDAEHKNTALDRSQLFRSKKSFGSLKYFAPYCEDGKVVVKPPREAMDEGILKWSPSLVG
jgi:hypothetical protein